MVITKRIPTPLTIDTGASKGLGGSIFTNY